jgi:hypothetical protein
MDDRNPVSHAHRPNIHPALGRQEFILLSDVLGVSESALANALNNPTLRSTAESFGTIISFGTIASSDVPSAPHLCTSGWRLAQLRAACSLWSFFRTSIFEKIWEEEVQLLPPPRQRECGVIADTNVNKFLVPPGRELKSSGFWGVALSLGLDRVLGWGESDKGKRAEAESEKRRFVAPISATVSLGRGHEPRLLYQAEIDQGCIR